MPYCDMHQWGADCGSCPECAEPMPWEQPKTETLLGYMHPGTKEPQQVLRYENNEAVCFKKDGWKDTPDQIPVYCKQDAHPDDIAVDKLAAAMKLKLAKAREKGRGGWEQADQADLSNMLVEHVEKGDPIDVANFCMMLWNRGMLIVPPAPLMWAVVYGSLEGVMFKSEKDARWTLTGKGCTLMGVPSIGEAFREDYGDYKLKLYQVRLVKEMK